MIFRINNEAREFLTVEALFHTLKLLLDDNENQDKPVFIGLDEAPDDHMLRAMADFLASIDENPCRFYIHSGTAEEQKTLIDLQRFIYRQNQDQLLAQSSLAHEVDIRLNANLRSAKVNWVKGIQLQTVSIQHQHQYQQQQQQQQQQVTSIQHKSRRKREIQPDELSNNPEPLNYANNLGTLIDRTTVATLSQETQRSAEQLLQIWDNLVGEQVSQVTDYRRKITQVQQEAMLKVIEHAYAFTFGIVPNNLPAGFYLQEVLNPPMQVLCYDEELAIELEYETNPLKIKLSPLPELAPLGSVQNLISYAIKEQNPTLAPEILLSLLQGDRALTKAHCPDYKNYQRFYNDLMTAECQNAIRFFVGKLVVNRPDRLTRINAFLEQSTLDQGLLQGLGCVLIHSGIVALDLYILRLMALKQSGSFAHFRANFLTSPDSHALLSNEENLLLLKKLSMLDDTQKAWWESLVNQHIAAGGRADFAQLFQAWDYFLAELNKMGLKPLDQLCPIQPIKNLQTALDRALFIIKTAGNRHSQMHNLSQLDFGPSGAWQAFYYDYYDLATTEMGLSYQYNQERISQDGSFKAPNKEELFDQLAGLNPEEARLVYYRYLGTQPIESIQVFRQIDEGISQDNTLEPADKNALLALAALLGTKLQESDNPLGDWERFIALLKQISASGSLQETLLNIRELDSLDTMPGIDQLNTFLKLIAAEPIETIQAIIPNFINACRLIPKLNETLDFVFSALLKRQELSNNGHLSHQPLNLMDFFGSIPPLLSNLNLSNPIKHYLIKLMPFLLDNWNPNSINYIRGRLLNLFDFKPQQLLIEVFDLLLMVNVAASETLIPSWSLSAITTILITEQGHIPTDKKERNQYLRQIIQETIPTIVLDNNPVNIFEIDMITDLKRLLDDLLIRNILDKFKSTDTFPFTAIRDFNKKEIERIEAFVNLIESKNVSMMSILEALPRVEKAFFSLATSNFLLPLRPIASMMYNDIKLTPFFVEQFPSLSRLTLEKIIKKRSLILVIKDFIDNRYRNIIQYNLNKLQSDAFPTIQDYLLSLSPRISIDKNRSSQERVDELRCKLEENNQLIKEMLKIKAVNFSTYQELLALLNHSNHLELLINALGIHNLTILLEQLHEHPVGLIAQLSMIIEELSRFAPAQIVEPDLLFNELISLSANYHLVNKEDFLSLLRIAFQHNLRHHNPFPTQAMFAIKGITQLSEQESERLFNQLTQMIGRVPENLIQHLPDFIHFISQAVISTPAKVPLVINLIINTNEVTEESMSIIQDIINSAPPTEPNLSHWLRIMEGCGASDLAQKQRIKNLLANHPDYLAAISSLYHFKPYPPLTRLETILASDSESLNYYIQTFDLDPGHQRSSPEAIERQFSNARIAPVVASLATLDGSPFSQTDCFMLAQELTYLNAIGRRYPIQMGERLCPDLTQASRTELRDYFQTLHLLLSQTDPDAKNHKRNQLHLLAVLRELYFRSTGNFPFTSQMLVLLLSLRAQSNLLLQINAGQGKTVTTAMLAALRWALNGGTVDVFTANTGLISRDYLQEGSEIFFTALNIPSTMILAHSEAFTRKILGINYTTISDLSLYNQRARLEGEELNTLINGRPAPMHCIIDESDAVILDYRILLNLAMQEHEEQDINPHAWIYPLLNNFVNQEDFRNINSEQGEVWNQRVDIQKLKHFLVHHASNDKQRAQLANISNSHYNRWIDAACEAARLREGKDYIIQQKDNISVCVPLIANNPCPGNTFTYGTQQCLHALEQVKNPNQHFTLQAELTITSSESAKNVLDEYNAHGTLIALSASPAGTLSEQLEQETNLDFECITIPPHNPSERIYYGTHITTSPQKHAQRIQKEIEENIKEHGANAVQPTLILCKDINQARAMHANLQALAEEHGLSLQLVTGEESTEAPDANSKTELQTKIDAAGENNVITIATSLMGRGTDIKPTHNDGLWVIQAYMDTERGQIQNIGRGARNGQIGRYTNIYFEGDLLHYGDIRGLSRMSEKNRNRHLHQLSKRLNQEHAIERYYTQQVSSINHIIMTQFNQWHNHMLHNGGDKFNDAYKRLLIKDRKEFINLLDDLWYDELQASDPDNQYPNRFVRRDANNHLRTEALNQALLNYQTQAIAAWERLVQEKLLIRANNLAMTAVNTFRTDMLASIDLAEQINTGQNRLDQDKKQALEEKRENLLSLEYALNPAAAILSLGDIKTPQERSDRAKEAAAQQLQLVIRQFNRVLEQAKLTKTQQKELVINDTQGLDNHELLHLLANQIQAYQTIFNQQYAEQIKLQPLIKAFLHIADYAKNPDDSSLQEKLDELKKEYLDTIIDKLIIRLEQELAWAEPNNSTWEFKLERNLIQKGSRQILADIQTLKGAPDEDKAEGLKRLYQTLHEQQIKLGSVWTLALGHRDTRKVIADAIRLIDNTAVMSTINEDFRQEAKEKAVYQVYWEKLASTLSHLQQPDTPKWHAIKDKINALGKDMPSLHVFQQCLNLLNQEKTRAQSTPRSRLLRPLQTLINRLGQIISTLTSKHQHLMTQDSFIKQKQSQLESNLKNINGIVLDTLSLRRGHTGFNAYYELRLKAKVCDQALLPGFTYYPGETHRRLETMKQALLAEMNARQIQTKHAILEDLRSVHLPKARNAHQLIHTQRPIASSSSAILTDLLSPDYQLPNPGPLFPKLINSQIKEYNKLVARLNEPGPLYDNSKLKNTRLVTEFLSKIKALDNNQWIDQEPISLEINNLYNAINHNERDIETQKIKIRYLERELNAKINETTKEEQNLLKKLRNWGAETFETDGSMVKLKAEIKEKEQVLAESTTQLTSLKNQHQELIAQRRNQLEDKLRTDFNNELQKLLTTVIASVNQAYQPLNLYITETNQKITELDRMIACEQEKLTIVSRRFESLDELLAFEVDLLNLKQQEENPFAQP